MQNLYDNQSLRAIDFLRKEISSGSKLSFVSAYFTIYAYQDLQDKLDTIDSLRFLFGEPRFVQSIDPEKNAAKAFHIQDDRLKLYETLHQKALAYRCSEWIKQKVEIRSMAQSNLLHGKLYHIKQHDNASALLGSSNFTRQGLGSATRSNIELNIALHAPDNLRELSCWFENLWNDEALTKDVKADVLHYLEQLYINHPPETIYFKTLYHIFQDYIDQMKEDQSQLDQTSLQQTAIWDALYDFQKDGVKAALHKIRAYGGCILADSVGLGKTYTALAVIKYFELKNQRVLVLCPKRLRSNWTEYLANVGNKANPLAPDRFAYTVLSHTDLSREEGKVGDIKLESFHWEAYDLIVIDESHNFRNNSKGKRAPDGTYRKSRYEKLLEDVLKKGIRTKVLLLSATPVNNDLRDLHNQLRLITHNEDTAFYTSIGISSLQSVMSSAQNSFTKWSKQRGEQNALDASSLMDTLPASFFTLLDALTIARSRKHICRHYESSLKQIGGFPERRPPLSRHPDIDSSKQFPSFQVVHDRMDSFKLSLYRPSLYLKPGKVGLYYKSSPQQPQQVDRERFLIGMMKVNFLKRLESSVFSFSLSMQNIVDKIQATEDALQEAMRSTKKTLSLKEINDDTSDEYEEDNELSIAAKEVFSLISQSFDLKDLDIPRWLKDLADDKAKFRSLASAAKNVKPESDAKLLSLRQLIEEKLKSGESYKDGSPKRKVLVFTAFADTAKYLYEQLSSWATTKGIHSALVTGGASPNKTTFGANSYEEILLNFAPRAKKRSLHSSHSETEEIDLLIATDCISEGQNLQDCDLLVNYDIHWNPVRIVQRFGRIDRIGSENASVQMVNFWPTPDLEQYIKLKGRVEARMMLVDLTATFEDNLLDHGQTQELQEAAVKEFRYRDEQLLRFRDEVLDIEDFEGETLTLNQFNLDDFRLELFAYLASKQEYLASLPFGLYGVTAAAQEQTTPKGVIFCLKQTKHEKASPQEAIPNKALEKAVPSQQQINALHPYFLVYIQNNGSIRYNFAQPKQILDRFRELCLKQTKPNQVLCELFDKQTQHGSNMECYDNLLGKALSAITQQTEKRVLSNLFQSKDAILPKQQDIAKSESDFELISWLVVASR